jgi:hypothetical protein
MDSHEIPLALLEKVQDLLPVVRMVSDYARRKSPARARLGHLTKGGGRVRERFALSRPLAQPATGEEKACGVACRIGVGVEILRPNLGGSKVYRKCIPFSPPGKFHASPGKAAFPSRSASWCCPRGPEMAIENACLERVQRAAKSSGIPPAPTARR